MPRRNDVLRGQVMEAIKAGIHTPAEIAALHSLKSEQVNSFMAHMAERGELRRVSVGHYVLPEADYLFPPPVSNTAPPPETVPTKVQVLIENVKRHVSIPPFLRRRVPATITVIREEDEIEGVVRLELHIGETWFPVHFQGNLRMLLGKSRPNWSGTQVTYENVSAYRITTVMGEEFEVGHNREFPLTIDGMPEANDTERG